MFYLTPEFHELLKDQRTAADEVQRQKNMIVQQVFFHRPVKGSPSAGSCELHFLSLP